MEVFTNDFAPEEKPVKCRRIPARRTDLKNTGRIGCSREEIAEGDRKIKEQRMDSFANREAADETFVFTAAMVITGDISIHGREA